MFSDSSANTNKSLTYLDSPRGSTLDLRRLDAPSGDIDSPE